GVEILEAIRLNEEGDSIREGLCLPDDDEECAVGSISCDCLFFRKYRLPCRHIFHHHLMYNSLNDSIFTEWSRQWDEYGFEVYEAMELYSVAPRPMEVEMPVKERLAAREM